MLLLGPACAAFEWLQSTGQVTPMAHALCYFECHVVMYLPIIDDSLLLCSGTAHRDKYPARMRPNTQHLRLTS